MIPPNQQSVMCALCSGDGVFQWNSVLATYYTPMDLRAFPFDQQRLLVQASQCVLGSHGWPLAGQNCGETCIALCRGSCLSVAC